MTYEERMRRNKLFWKCLLIGVIVFLAAWIFMHTGRRRAIAGIGDPIQQELALKLYTVTLMCLDILLEVGRGVLPCKTVRILSLR